MSEESRYNYFYLKFKRLYKDKRYQISLAALNEAFKIKPTEDLQSKINKLENLLNKDKLLIHDKYYVNTIKYNKLYNYQKEGILWLFQVFEAKKGCILADDMGLGKTIQIIFYLRELFESELIKTVLIIIPKSLLINWKREIQIWAPSLQLLTYFGNDRERNLRRIQKKGGIMITTYGTVMHSWDELNYNPDFKWDILALDEGHKIKNPSSKTFKAINALRANLRIIMTGTAVQNNLKELWALLDFTHQGSLLGLYETFEREYEKPITDSRKKNASQHEKLHGDRIALSLKKLIKPFFLRRTKEEVTKQTDFTIDQKAIPKLCKKNDIVVWIPMTKAQIEYYKKFLELDEIKMLLMRTEKRSPLLELNILKKICDHPRLIKQDLWSEMGLEKAESIDVIEIKQLISESGKMVLLVKLVKNMVEESQKCLIFSQSLTILNIIARVLKSNRIKFLRLDGSILKATKRQSIVDNFNNDPELKILLLTTQVGGVGLTLTGANRVIIYDLNWNPSVDAQAVDRIYRIGQKKNVVIYRLITCGTVEEKKYRRQIFKDSLNRQTTGINKTDDNSIRYFTHNELYELFTLNDPYKSDTQILLHDMHSSQRKPDPYLDNHIEWLVAQNIFGISHHDLMFSYEDKVIDVDQETQDILLANSQQAENTLVKEAQLKLSTDEIEMRHLLGAMSINDKKGHNKEQILMENMFIPNKADIKRPFFNEPYKNYHQPEIDNSPSIHKISSNAFDIPDRKFDSNYYGTDVDRYSRLNKNIFTPIVQSNEEMPTDDNYSIQEISDSDSDPNEDNQIKNPIVVGNHSDINKE